MSIVFAKFAPGDLDLVEAQAWQAEEAGLGRGGLAEALAEGLSFTGWRGDLCIGCGGIMLLHPQRAFLWTYLSKHARPHMVAITRFVRQITTDYPAKRLEATVLPGFVEAHRWMSLLGFEKEATLEAYDELGRDMTMYKRIRR